MGKLVYNVQTRQLQNDDPLGSSGYMSFNRLAAYLQDAECQPDEILTHIVITREGLTLRVRRMGAL